MSRTLCHVLWIACLAAGCAKTADTTSPNAGSAAAPATESKPTMDPAAAKKLIAEGAPVVDVRTGDEFAGGHLATATNIPIDQFDARIAEVDKLVGGDKTKPVVVHCAAGKRAAKAKAALEAAGYTHVVNGRGYDDLK